MKRIYESPSVELVQVVVENGFAASGATAMIEGSRKTDERGF